MPTKGFYYQFARLAIRLLLAIYMAQAGGLDRQLFDDARGWLERNR